MRQVTVLGSCGAFPEPGRACSGVAIEWDGPSGGPRLPLYCPPGVLDRLAGLEPDVDLRTVFDPRPLPGHHRAGPFALTGTLLPHWVDNAGIRLEADGTAIAYSGDTGPTPLLADLGRDADLFIVEATDRPGERERPDRNLMTAAEAGLWARRAHARRVMLTHFWPGNDRTAALQAPGTAFPGEILIANEDLTIPLGYPARGSA